MKKRQLFGKALDGAAQVKPKLHPKAMGADFFGSFVLLVGQKRSFNVFRRSFVMIAE